MATHGCIACTVCGAGCLICSGCTHASADIAPTRPFMCRLTRVFELQERLMREYQSRTPDGIPEWPMDMAQKKSQRFMKDTLSKCQDELAESKYLLKRAKEHRDNDGMPLDRAELLEEMVDALHFYVEACVLLGVSPDELAAAYEKKNDVNLRRIDDEFGPCPQPASYAYGTDVVIIAGAKDLVIRAQKSTCCDAPIISSDPDEFGYMTSSVCAVCAGQMAP